MVNGYNDDDDDDNLCEECKKVCPIHGTKPEVEEVEDIQDGWAWYHFCRECRDRKSYKWK